MFPADFEYYRADTVAEAVALMSQHEGAKLLAGGHSLIPLLKMRLAQPAALIDIGRVSELRGIAEVDGAVRIGALTTHAQLADSRELRDSCRILSEAASKIGDPQVRNKGTIGGNIAHADPASDLPAVLVVVGATIHLSGPEGQRSVPAAEFFTGLLTTAVAAAEIVTHVDAPMLAEGSGCAYLKMEHPASGYAVCGAAAIVEMGDDGACSDARLCFNGISEKPFQSQALSAALVGSGLEDSQIDDAVEKHLRAPDPLADAFASAAYRAHLARVYGKRALKQARDRCKR